MSMIQSLVQALTNTRRVRQRRKSRTSQLGTAESCEMRLLLAAPGQVQLEEIEYVRDADDPTLFIPTATFSPVDGADEYQTWVSYANVERVRLETVEPQFENGVPTQMRVGFGSSLGVSISSPGFYYWVWFRAGNEDGYGEWSVGRKITIPNGEPPTELPNLSLGNGALLSAPTVGYTANQIDLDRASVRWERDPRAQVYDVIAWKNGVPVGDIYNTGISVATSTVQFDDNGVYEFWVRARNGVRHGPWSYRAVVGIGTTPEVTAPSGNSLPARPEFNWTRGAGGQNYELWVTNEATNQRVIHQTTLTQQSYTPTTDLPDGIYKVWVREITATGYKLPWSTAVRFEVGTNTRLETPVLSHVDSTSSGTDRDFRGVFNWTAVAGANHYEFYLANPNTGSPLDNPDNLTDTTYTTIQLQPKPGGYRSWVRAINALGIGSDWSNPLVINIGTDGRVEVIGT